MADDDSDAPERRRQEPPPIEFLKPGETQAPPPTPQAPVAWVTRPEDYQQPRYPQGPAPPRQAPLGRLGIYAGILLLLAGAFGIAGFVHSSLVPVSPSQYANLTSDSTSYLVNQICAMIIIWSQAAAILGGIMAIQRLNWKLTMVCAIFATLTFGFYFEASLMGVVACVLVALARREFLS